MVVRETEESEECPNLCKLRSRKRSSELVAFGHGVFLSATGNKEYLCVPYLPPNPLQSLPRGSRTRPRIGNVAACSCPRSLRSARTANRRSARSSWHSFPALQKNCPFPPSRPAPPPATSL